MSRDIGSIPVKYCPASTTGQSATRSSARRRRIDEAGHLPPTKLLRCGGGQPWRARTTKPVVGTEVQFGSDPDTLIVSA